MPIDSHIGYTRILNGKVNNNSVTKSLLDIARALPRTVANLGKDYNNYTSNNNMVS